LPVQRLQPLAPILQFCYYDQSNTIQPLNPNFASIEMLTQIPAVDLFLARAIVQQRQTHGPYRHLADLQQRLRLTSAVTADLLHYLRFS
jgi:DNA uptake protein ComE-like DNA-binding protein